MPGTSRGNSFASAEAAMPITFPCPCGKRLKVPDTLAGKKVKCPECQAPVQVPAIMATPPPANPRPAHPSAPRAADKLPDWLEGADELVTPATPKKAPPPAQPRTTAPHPQPAAAKSNALLLI